MKNIVSTAHQYFFNIRFNVPKGESIVSAGMRRDKEKLQWFIDKGADINTPNDDGDTLLHFFANGQDSEMIDFLLKNKADHARESKFGDNALYLVCKNDTTFKMDTFMGPRMSLKDEAALNRIKVFECAKPLIDAGADVNAIGPKGHTPFIYACIKENNELVSLMLKNKANVFHKNNYGHTALCYALQSNNGSTLDIILESFKDLKEFETYRHEILQLKAETKKSSYDIALDTLNAIEIKRQLDSDLPPKTSQGKARKI